MRSAVCPEKRSARPAGGGWPGSKGRRAIAAAHRPPGPSSAAASAPDAASPSRRRGPQSPTTMPPARSSRPGRTAACAASPRLQPSSWTRSWRVRARTRSRSCRATPIAASTRGHNPAERLAARARRRWQLPVVPLLARAPGVRPQRGLPLAERRRNVRGVFQATGPAPRELVLVDDVYTSGATVSAAASALRKAGARRVEVVTFARAVR